MIFLYVMGIVFKMQLGPDAGPETSMDEFSSIYRAICTLFMDFCLGDNPAYTGFKIKAKGGWFMFFLSFIMLYVCMFMFVNMLVGVICSVVADVSEETKEDSIVTYVKYTLKGKLAELTDD